MTPLETTHSAASQLPAQLDGKALLPDTPGYDEARTLWNAMIDRRPALIVQPRNAADVAAAIRFARAGNLEIAVKGGGHNVAGNAACDDGLMIDFAEMNAVRVDPDARIAWVEPGALVGDLDRETQEHGLAAPGGFISTTGVAGLTLGGGFGYLSRKHGLTVDSLRAVDLVTADGREIRASADENPELFWGLCGGGGNFGVATAFVFDLQAVGPEVLAGPVVHAWEDAADALSAAAEAMHEASDDVACLPVLRHAPPAPFIPEAHHGHPILLLALVHLGKAAEAEAALAPLRAIGNPIADAVAPRPYIEFQSMFDKTAAHGARNYWKGHYLDGIPREAAQVLCDRVPEMRSKESSIGMLSLGGAIGRRPSLATPYPHRSAAWVLNIQARWRDAEADNANVNWARETFAAMKPHTAGGVYVNFVSGDEGEARVHEAYDEATYRRLAMLKAEWDPENALHLNQNVRPAA